MGPDNPAVYECPKGSGGLHLWVSNPNMTATCFNCGYTLSVVHASEVFQEDHDLVQKINSGVRPRGVLLDGPRRRNK